MATTSGSGQGGKFEAVYSYPYASRYGAPSGGAAIAMPNPPKTTTSILASPAPAGPDMTKVIQDLLNSLTGKGGGGGGGGGGGAQKSDDSHQVDALRRMIFWELNRSRDTKLGNIESMYKETDADILRSAGLATENLREFRRENDKAEASGTFANLLNSSRETADLLEQAALLGAGETDALKTTLQAQRNWLANQSEVSRAAADTNASINSSIRDLNSSVTTGRLSAWQQKEKDREQTYANYYNQLQDTYTQLGNIEVNPNSQQFNKGETSFASAATTAGLSYKTADAPASLKSWESDLKTRQPSSNISQVPTTGPKARENAPSGAGLRRW